MKLKDLFAVRVFTISNFLSLARIILVVPFAWLMLTEKPGFHRNNIELYLLIFMFSTDFLDGWLARKLGQETPLGQYLDPVADKIAIIGVLTLLVMRRDFPEWVLWIILLREAIAFTAGLFLLTRRDILGKPNYWGKAGVFFVSVSAVFYLMEWPYKEYTLIPVVITLVGGVVAYFVKYRKTIFHEEDEL